MEDILAYSVLTLVSEIQHYTVEVTIVIITVILLVQVALTHLWAVRMQHIWWWMRFR